MPLDNHSTDEAKTNQSASVGAEMLRYIERVERLEEEKKDIQSSIKDVYQQAEGRGFDKKVLRQMIRERAMEPNERSEWQALCETYRAALGMLDGTPLGDAARRRFMGAPAYRAPPPSRPPQDGDADGAQDDVPLPGFEPPETPEPEADPEPSGPTPEDVAAAREAGAAAALAGKAILDNPHPAMDPRRAAWDEAFCAHANSDGMDIPAAWRRAPKAKGDGKAGSPPPGGGQG